MDAYLKMDRPVEKSRLDETHRNIVSSPLDRVDGPLKVSGRATYAAEFAFPDLAHGVLVGAAIGKGRVVAVDAAAVEQLPGIVAVVTDERAFLRNPAQGMDEEGPARGGREISYFGQPVALVVGETFEAARHGARALKIGYEAGEGRFDFAARRGTAEPKKATVKEKGNLEAAMKSAHATVDEIYTTPSQSNAPMEPHATTAIWQGERLTLYGSYQMPASNRLQVADSLGLDVENVRILSPYVGGGFGSKLGISAELIAAAVASRQLGRPVRVVMTRQQVFETTVRRSNTEQRLRLAAASDGRLTGIGHESLTANLDGEDFSEPVYLSTHFLYAGASRKYSNAIVRMDQVLSASMRAPGEAVGMLALECAMDELAEKLGLDPLELRRINEPERDPQADVPFSSRSLIACMEKGAEAFGWSKRAARPRSRREGEWWIGLGIAASARSNMLIKSSARVTLAPGGKAVVETDMTDIGTGTYTILTQIAAEMLGLAVGDVDVRLGDTDYPAASGSGGSFGAASVGSAVYLAAEKIRERLAAAAGCPPDELTLSDGRAIAGNVSQPIADLIAEPLVATGTVEPGEAEDRFTQAAFGAHFVEVGVNAHTGEVRVRRFESTFAAGRILNEKTARSQCIGGLVFGIGAALTEDLMHDTRTGQIVNRDLAEYHLPVNADVPALKVTFLEERDTAVNPLLAKGIGELSISGAGAAIANAIYNACGVRVRHYPITLDKLIAKMPDG